MAGRSPPSRPSFSRAPSPTREKPREVVARTLPAVTDWQALRNGALHHGVTALLYRRIVESAGTWIPPEQLDSLHALATANARRSLRMGVQLLRLVELMSGKGAGRVAHEGSGDGRGALRRRGVAPFRRPRYRRPTRRRGRGPGRTARRRLPADHRRGDRSRSPARLGVRGRLRKPRSGARPRPALAAGSALRSRVAAGRGSHRERAHDDVPGSRPARALSGGPLRGDVRPRRP